MRMKEKKIELLTKLEEDIGNMSAAINLLTEIEPEHSLSYYLIRQLHAHIRDLEKDFYKSWNCLSQ